MQHSRASYVSFRVSLFVDFFCSHKDLGEPMRHAFAGDLDHAHFPKDSAGIHAALGGGASTGNPANHIVGIRESETFRCVNLF